MKINIGKAHIGFSLDSKETKELGLSSDNHVVSLKYNPSGLLQISRGKKKSSHERGLYTVTLQNGRSYFQAAHSVLGVHANTQPKKFNLDSRIEHGTVLVHLPPEFWKSTRLETAGDEPDELTLARQAIVLLNNLLDTGKIELWMRQGRLKGKIKIEHILG